MILIKFCYDNHAFNAAVPVEDVTPAILEAFDAIDNYHATKIRGPSLWVAIRRLEEFSLRYMATTRHTPDTAGLITRIMCVPFVSH